MAADPARKGKKKGAKGGGGSSSQDVSAARVALGAGNMREAVKKPDGEDINEWYATNMIDFFNEITLFYGIVSEYVTDELCPIMSAGPKYEYLWAEYSKKNGKKITLKVGAASYINKLFTWVNNQINDPRKFPIEDNAPFPDNFKEAVVEPMSKHLLRVYAHLYHHHIQRFVQLDAEAHLNTCFKHFLYFTKEFKLVNDREYAPLQNTIDTMLSMDGIQ